MSHTNLHHSLGWYGRPLCRHFLAIVFTRTFLGCSASGSAAPLSLRWALAATGAGQVEVIGWWPNELSSVFEWQSVSAELHARGMERVRFLITDDPTFSEAAFQGGSAIVLGADCTPEGLPSIGLAARHRRAIEQANSLANSINASIVRRLKRKAPLGCAADALEVATHSLLKAQRRIDASPVAASLNNRTSIPHAVRPPASARGKTSPAMTRLLIS